MKKFLLVAFAALLVGSATAQFAKKQAAGKPQAQREIVQKAAVKKSYSAVSAKEAKAVLDKTSKALELTAETKNALKLVGKKFASNKRTAKAGLNKIEKPSSVKILGMRKADANNSIEGTWTFALGDYYFQTSTLSTLYVDFEAELLEGGLVTFEDPTGNELPFVAVFDEQANTLTFSPMYTYQVTLQGGGVYQLYQNPFVYNYEKEDLDHQVITATYNPEKGEIKFAKDNGIAWEAHSDTEGTFAGYFGIYDLEGASRDGSGGGGSEGGDVTVQAVYEGTGTQVNEGSVEWEMYLGTATDGTLLVQDVIPSPFDGGVVVEYTRVGNNIVIAPQVVASGTSAQSPTGELYVYLESATSTDGSITLTMDNAGNITGTYSILYGAYSTDTYNDDDYLGYYGSFVQNIKYTVPGNIVTPTVSFEPGNLVLFAGLGLNGYSFLYNLAFTGAYAPVSFNNLTTDKVTEWQWSVSRESVDEEEAEVYQTGNEKDFTFNTVGGDAYSDIQLVGVNQTAVSQPFTFGWGKSDVFADYGFQLYAGGSESQFILNNETPAIITRQDPDGDLTFYTNWATPEKATNSMSKIYCYHEKPATPLYIEGVTLPLVNGSYNSDFNLHIKIYEASYPIGGKLSLGRVLAEGDATVENVNADYNMGLTAVEFTDLYVEDEIGMSETIKHLFLDTEFVIAIEGWDNGTFTGVLGSQDAPLDNARASTWFEMTGEEGSMYSYTSWKTSLFVGLLGATSGWLYTEDDTNVSIPASGEAVSIKVHPMYANIEANENGSLTRLWLDDSSDEIPEWLAVGIANEDYDETFTFDLVFEADALPEGAESRSATLVFVQEGAKLTVTVTQEAGETGISTVTKTTTDGKVYNLSGRQVKPAHKGLVISNGKKYIAK